MSYPVMVDTSAFHALRNIGDVLEYEIATAVAKHLERDGAALVTTDYVLDETYTLFRMTLGHKAAVDFGLQIQQGGIEIVQVDESIQENAWEIFARYRDKRFSFTDCTSFVVMERARIRGAFTFDRHFQQYGFQTFPSKLPSRRH